MGYRSKQTERCPYCYVTVRFVAAKIFVPGGMNTSVDRFVVGVTELHACYCPNCDHTIITAEDNGSEFFVIPRGTTRPPLHQAVPAELVRDYEEAALVSSLSPKASAALSRRCLQTLLLLNNFKQNKLADQLVAARSELPTYLQPFVDNIRALGNLSAHPKWDKASAEIVDVEPHEAEWLLDLLDALFDHFYVKPFEYATKQSALNAKTNNISSSPPAPPDEP